LAREAVLARFSDWSRTADGCPPCSCLFATALLILIVAVLEVSYSMAFRD
jgi:hypothetical protein